MASLYRSLLTDLALLFLTLLLILMALLPSADGAGTVKSKISAVFVFGDSVVDPGNNNHRLTEAKANFPPYGQDFPGGKATGRFSNGEVSGDMLASRFGIKELLPPYLGDDLPLSELLTVVVFASGGGGYDPFTSIPVNARSSTEQHELFLKYKERLKASVGEDEMTRVISKGIYFTVMGANDLKLNEMGAKKIGFIGIPPIGCCPSQRKLGSRECETMRNQAAKLFNSEIAMEIHRLNAEKTIQGSKFIYLDIYYNLLELIQQPGFYGFKEATEGCCGSTLLNAAIFVKNHHACPTAYDYIFWDNFHPTEKAYNIVVDKLFHTTMQYLM